MNAKDELYVYLRKENGEDLTDEELDQKIDEITTNVLKRLVDIHPYRYCYTCQRACDQWKTCPNYNGGDHNE